MDHCVDNNDDNDDFDLCYVKQKRWKYDNNTSDDCSKYDSNNENDHEDDTCWIY